MSPSSSRASKVAPLAVAGIALALLFGVLAQALFGLTTGPEEELLTQLKRVEKDGLRAELGALGALESDSLVFNRMTVDAEPGAPTALAITTLDFNGTFGDGRTKVSSLGLEQIPFAEREREWTAVKGYAPNLFAVIELLERRRRALGDCDAVALAALAAPGSDAGPRVEAALAELRPLTNRSYQAKAWYLRSERESVEVVEEYRLEGTLPERPVSQTGKVALRLQRGETGYFFSGSLR